MAIKGCKGCKVNPAMKCQRCKNHFCEEHKAVEGKFDPIETPYRLCKGCYLEFYQWRLDVKWVFKGRVNLCCILNEKGKCPFCQVRFCDEHRHNLINCLAWIKWKWSPRVVGDLSCCLQALGKKTDRFSGPERCAACRYPNCGHTITKHVGVGPYSGNKKVRHCQLCGYTDE